MPSLRFKSGTSFELSNKNQTFQCRFFYGDSKNIKQLKLNQDSYSFFSNRLSSKCISMIKRDTKVLKSTNPNKLQQVWIESEKGLNPFEVIDIIDEIAITVFEELVDADQIELIEEVEDFYQIKLSQKLKDNIYRIYSGLIVCSFINFKVLYKS